MLHGVTKFQTALINILELALHDHRDDVAELYAGLSDQFCLPEWMIYNAHLQLALERKDKETCLSILKKMLPAMKKVWNPQACPLYRNE